MDIIERADQHLKDELIEKLLTFGYTKMEDGKQLYELSVQELKELYLVEMHIEEELQRQSIIENER